MSIEHFQCPHECALRWYEKVHHLLRMKKYLETVLILKSEWGLWCEIPFFLFSWQDHLLLSFEEDSVTDFKLSLSWLKVFYDTVCCLSKRPIFFSKYLFSRTSFTITMQFIRLILSNCHSLNRIFLWLKKWLSIQAAKTLYNRKTFLKIKIW